MKRTSSVIILKMKRNLIMVSAIIVVGFGALAILVYSGNKQKSETPKANQNSQESSAKDKQTTMGPKQYPSPPGVLPENERVGKKAVFETNMGSFTVKLHGDKTPKTVSNFIFLAKDGFYDGLVFHRVIADFMIQGGDPLGNGTGGPGYQFEDEFDSTLSFSKPGLLAMANAGPATNGSQFFITVTNTPHLNNKHTIFGEVSEGYDVVEKISKVEADASDKPQNPVIVNKIEII